MCKSFVVEVKIEFGRTTVEGAMLPLIIKNYRTQNTMFLLLQSCLSTTWKWWLTCQKSASKEISISLAWVMPNIRGVKYGHRLLVVEMIHLIIRGTGLNGDGSVWKWSNEGKHDLPATDTKGRNCWRCWENALDGPWCAVCPRREELVYLKRMLST